MKLSKFFEKYLKLFKKNEKLLGISIIFLEILIDGIVLNFMVFSIFNLKFTWYSWIGWGFVPYFLGEMIPRIIVKFKKRMK
jgi:hypothetical protein